MKQIFWLTPEGMLLMELLRFWSIVESFNSLGRQAGQSRLNINSSKYVELRLMLLVKETERHKEDKLGNERSDPSRGYPTGVPNHRHRA